MGTKLNPGSFDCHEAAADDEPLFTLLARDQLAPHLVLIWACIRGGDPITALDEFNRMVQDHIVTYDPEAEKGKVQEAAACAESMQDWRAANR